MKSVDVYTTDEDRDAPHADRPCEAFFTVVIISVKRL